MGRVVVPRVHIRDDWLNFCISFNIITPFTYVLFSSVVVSADSLGVTLVDVQPKEARGRTGSK